MLSDSIFDNSMNLLNEAIYYNKPPFSYSHIYQDEILDLIARHLALTFKIDVGHGQVQEPTYEEFLDRARKLWEEKEREEGARNVQ